MNKKLLYGLALPLFVVMLVTAAYVVNSFVLTTDVIEPFTVEYAIIGDGGNWDGVTTCENYTGEWQVGTNVDVGGLYAGEGRYVCTKITNAGEGDVDYTFSGVVTGGNESCETIFGGISETGTVPGLTTIRDGSAIVIADDAIPVEDCQITLSVSRG